MFTIFVAIDEKLQQITKHLRFYRLCAAGETETTAGQRW